jgi:DNA adenine methylase
MPYTIRKLPNKDLYKVYNTQTKSVHSYATTLENAEKQVKLLHMVDAGVPLEKQGGNFAEDGKNLKPIFGRVGSKYSLIKDVIDVIPPHTTYVEAFVGGGSIFWNKEPAKKSVINDLDKDLVDAYRNLKSAPLSQLQQLEYLDRPDDKKSDYKTPTYKKHISQLMEELEKITPTSSAAKKLLKYFKISRGTFNNLGKGSIYFNMNIKPYIERIEEYKRLLKNTTITNKDYIDVIKEYDSPSTFFLLDPPYEESGNLYKSSSIDYNEMNTILKGIKGKFLLTINDSKVISDIFKGFNQKKVSVTNNSNSPYFVTTARKELFISNYDIKKGGSIETDRFEEEGEVSLPEFKSVKVELPTYMYKILPDIKGNPPPYRYRLINPINSSRNIASRKKEKAIDITRKAISQPYTFYEEGDERPKIEEFSPQDQEKIEEYYKDVVKNEKKDRDQIENQPAMNAPRGFPVTMYKTADRLGYKATDAKVYKRKEVVEKPVKPRKEPTAVRARGRPKKGKKVIQIEGEEEDLFANLVPRKEQEFQKMLQKLTEESVSSIGSKSSKSSSVSSDKSLPSFPSMSSSRKSKSVSSESSIASDKSSKKASSVASDESMSSEDLNLYLTDRSAFNKKFGLGINNNISSNNKMNSWISYVKEYASKNGMSYRDALRDPKCKAGYKKGGVVKKGRGVVDEMGNQDLISIAYDDSELGANAGKKYISL